MIARLIAAFETDAVFYPLQIVILPALLFLACMIV